MGDTKRVLVCVTQQKTCERLIKKGYAMSCEYNGELYVIHVAMNGVNFLGNSKEGEALEYLFDISKSVGAELTVLRSDNIVKSIVAFSKDYGISDIVLGEPPDNSRDSNIISDLCRKLPSVSMHVVPPEKM